MPVLHIDHKPGVVLHASVAAFEPMIEPAYGLVPPLHLRPEVRLIRAGGIPRNDDRFVCGFWFHEHIGNVIAVTVLHAADQKTGNRNFAERPHPVPPERSVVLMLEVEYRPRRRVIARR